MAHAEARQTVAGAVLALLVAWGFVAWRWVLGPGRDAEPPALASLVAPVLWVALLLFGYLGLAAPAVRGAWRARTVRDGRWTRWALTWPAGLLVGATAYAAWAGVALVPRVLAYALYLGAPVVALTAGRSPALGQDATVPGEYQP